MEPMILEGAYSDASGSEEVTWLIEGSTRPGWERRYEVSGVIRGVRVWGADFDGLEPDSSVPVALALNSAGEVDECDLRVNVPVTLRNVPDPEASLLLTFHLGAGTYGPIVDAEITADSKRQAVSQDDRLEEVLGVLARNLEPIKWECCLTCGLSDYSPGGNGLMGMRCHRDARAEYLSVRSKMEYWGVPVTEDVPEFYRCDHYEHRTPGTCYRG